MKHKGVNPNPSRQLLDKTVKFVKLWRSNHAISE